MAKIDELLKEVNDQLNEEICVKEYFRLKNVIENDKELIELDKLVREHQTAMCKAQDNDEIYFKEKELYETYLNQLNNNPIYQNFEEVKKEVNALLKEMKDYLEQ